MAGTGLVPPPVNGVGRSIMKKLALSALVLAFAVSGATTGAEAQSRGKARPAPTGPEAMAKQCQEATKNMYTADQRVFTYGYCVSRLNYYGNQAQAAYGGQPQYYRGPPEQPPYRGQPGQPPYRGSGY
jgi:hypothetical protein